MQQKQLYSIGQTAKICMISIQTLRFYDKIGLLEPSYIDAQNGYRYYSSSDILRIKIIQDLRCMDFSLEEIGIILKRNQESEIIELMKAKREETLEKIKALENMAFTIQNRIEHLELQQTLRQQFQNHDLYVELKILPERYVAFERRKSACNMETYIMRFTELFTLVNRNHFCPDGHIMTIYHENIMEFDRNDSDIEVCVPIAEEKEPNSLVRTIPGGLYITASYCGVGNEERCKQVYSRLLDWMTDQGYEEEGPVIEQYNTEWTRMINVDDMMIEMQIPIRKTLTL